MSPDDARATRIGRATASLAVLVVGCAALLVLLAATGRKWATTGLWGCLLAGGVAWSIAYAEMIRHQRRTALPKADCDAWQERMFPVEARTLAFLGGIFVPWFYLLGSAAQRRLSVYERRPRRSRRSR
jgi:hypothetical protein